MTARHTPGPWTWEQRPDSKTEPPWDMLVINDLTGHNICIIELPDDSDEANARLIAAAPELLEALTKTQHELNALTRLGRTVIDASPEGDWNRVCGAVNAAEAAIAKAEGRNV